MKICDPRAANRPELTVLYGLWRSGLGCDLGCGLWRAPLQVLVLAGLPLLPAIAADDLAQAQGLLEQMTPAQRAATGVERLSVDERAALEAWLAKRVEQRAAATVNAVDAPTTRQAPVVTPPGESVAQQSTAAPAATEAEIEAEVERRVTEKLTEAKAFDMLSDAPFEAEVSAAFDGWSGKTLFRLTNGQMWRQRSNTRYRHQSPDRRVRFEKNWLGGWEMTVLESGRSVTVKRVK